MQERSGPVMTLLRQLEPAKRVLKRNTNAEWINKFKSHVFSQGGQEYVDSKDAVSHRTLSRYRGQRRRITVAVDASVEDGWVAVGFQGADSSARASAAHRPRTCSTHRSKVLVVGTEHNTADIGTKFQQETLID